MIETATKLVSQNEIDNYIEHGVVHLKAVFDESWLQLLQKGVDCNMSRGRANQIQGRLGDGGTQGIRAIRAPRGRRIEQ